MEPSRWITVLMEQHTMTSLLKLLNVVLLQMASHRYTAIEIYAKAQLQKRKQQNKLFPKQQKITKNENNQNIFNHAILYISNRINIL